MLAIDYFDRAAAGHPDRIAVTDGRLTFTYRELAELTHRIARALLASGLAPGCHVGILSVNHPMVLACQYAILRAGCVWVPANYRNLAADTARQFDKLDVSWVFYHSAQQAMVEAIRGKLPKIGTWLAVDQATTADEGIDTWLGRNAREVPLPPRGPDDAVWIGVTGGTSSGHMKGAVHTNRSWEMNIVTFHAIHEFRRPPVHLIVAPLTHAAGVFHWGMMIDAATHVLMSSAEPGAILRAIEDFRVTYVFLPPTIIYMLLTCPELHSFDLSTLEYLVFGSAPMSVEKLKQAAAVFGPVLCQSFGSTETLIMNAFLSREDLAQAVSDPAFAHRLASTGRESPYCRIEIMDEDGRLLPADERGEIVMHCSSAMKEYYHDLERTAQTQAGGWHHTGDIGIKDRDGYVYVVDRKNDMIISGSFNVYPGEVEQVVMSHPAVQDCAVVGVPHDKWGEMVLAAIELKAGQHVSEEEIIAYCRSRLGGVKTPKVVKFMDAMPRSAVGKTLRRLVRAEFWVGRDRQI